MLESKTSIEDLQKRIYDLAGKVSRLNESREELVGMMANAAVSLKEAAEQGEKDVARIQELEQALENAPWVPVSERYPEEGIPVLVTNLHYANPSILAALVNLEEADGVSGWCWNQFDGTNLSDTGSYEFDDDYIYTHWMPLPEPPQEKN